MTEDSPFSLLRQAQRMPQNAQARLLMAERAAKLFESEGDLDLAFEAHDEACDAACWSGHPDKMVVHTSWMLKKSDEHPGRFDQFMLLWRYKWTVSELPGFPAVGRDKISDMLEDCDRRFAAFGGGHEAISKIRFWVARMLGDDDDALRWAEAWRRAEQGLISDCRACEMDNEGDYWLWKGELDLALKAVQPVVHRLEGCAEVPHRTYARFLTPLWRAGRKEQALDWDKKGYRMLKDSPKMADGHSRHIVFSVLTGDLDVAAARLEHAAPAGLGYAQQLARLCFVLAARAVFAALLTDGRNEVAMNLPHGLSAAGKVNVKGALDWCEQNAQSMGEAFDTRNGNRTIGDFVRDDDLVGAVERFPTP